MTESNDYRDGLAVFYRGNGVVIPPNWINSKEFWTAREFVNDGPAKGALKLQPSQVEYWGLRSQDQVIIDGNGRIVQVWGISDPEKARTRYTYPQILKGDIPQIDDPTKTIGYGPMTYSQEEWPIWKSRNPTLNCLCAQAPVGPGVQWFITGNWGSGKTYAQNLVARALLEIARVRKDIGFVFLQIGERNIDLREKQELAEKAKGYDVPFFHYKGMQALDYEPVDRDITRAYMIWNLSLCEMARQSVFRMFESGISHVIYLVDSLSGMALQAYPILAPKGDGMTSGGVLTSALANLSRHTGLAGYIPSGLTSLFPRGGGITPIVTALNGEKTRAGNIFEEAGGPNSSSIWAFKKFHGEKRRPYMQLDMTETRSVEKMLRVDRLELHREIADLVQRIYKEQNGAAALEFIQNLAEEGPLDRWPQILEETSDDGDGAKLNLLQTAAYLSARAANRDAAKTLAERKASLETRKRWAREMLEMLQVRYGDLVVPGKSQPCTEIVLRDEQES